jgi:hypothetical protein
MSCNTVGPDGIVDLTLKLNNLSFSTFLAGNQKGIKLNFISPENF